MAGDDTPLNKRKREPTQEEPACKKPAIQGAAVEARTRERIRQEVGNVYKLYETLHTHTDDGARALAFQDLLDSAQGSP